MHPPFRMMTRVSVQIRPSLKPPFNFTRMVSKEPERSSAKGDARPQLTAEGGYPKGWVEFAAGERRRPSRRDSM